MVRRLHGTIAERSRSQLGLITRRQVLDLGLTEQQLWHTVRTGALERLEPQVFRIAGAPETWEQQLAAGLLGLGEEAVVSHLAAASLWRFDGIRPGAVEFTVPRGHRNRASVGTVHSSLSLEPEDIDVRGRFRVTSATRTIVDIAGVLARRPLEGVVDAACRDRVTTEEALLERAIRLRRPGRSKLFLVLGADTATGRPHTWLERELLAALRCAGAPLPQMQTVLTAQGRIARVDGCYAGIKLVIEVAGHATHSTRRQRQSDHERRLRLELDGYQVAEFTYEDVIERPDYVVATILKLHAERTQALATASTEALAPVR